MMMPIMMMMIRMMMMMMMMMMMPTTTMMAVVVIRLSMDTPSRGISACPARRNSTVAYSLQLHSALKYKYKYKKKTKYKYDSTVAYSIPTLLHSPFKTNTKTKKQE